MSRAFVKEDDGEGDLPERQISPHANFVTARGLAQLDERLRELGAERSRARSANDRSALARVARDLKYFQARRDSARVVEPQVPVQQVRFGVRVELELEDGTHRCFRIVGEDEADPAQGLISYVAPLATSLMGLEVDDELPFGERRARVATLSI